jgi:hypothetical protein
MTDATLGLIFMAALVILFAIIVAMVAESRTEESPNDERRRFK